MVTGDRSSNRSAGRPDTGRSGFNARRNELQRIRNKPIVFTVAAIIFSFVAIILHNNQQIKELPTPRVTGYRRSIIEGESEFNFFRWCEIERGCVWFCGFFNFNFNFDFRERKTDIKMGAGRRVFFLSSLLWLRFFYFLSSFSFYLFLMEMEMCARVRERSTC